MTLLLNKIASLSDRIDEKYLKYGGILALIGAAAFGVRHWHENRGVPPGPYSILYFSPLSISPYSISLCITNLCKKYKSDVVSFRIGGELFIGISSHKAVQEFVQKDEDAFSRRWTMPVLKLHIADDYNSGIFEASGDVWRTNRKFTIAKLTELGMGNSKGETLCLESMQIMLENLRREVETAARKAGRGTSPKELAGFVAPVDPQFELTTVVANTFHKLIYGEIWSDKPDFKQMMEHVMNLADLGSWFYPKFFWILMALIPFTDFHYGWRTIAAIDYFTAYNEKQTKQHIAHFDPNYLRDFVDMCLYDATAGGTKPLETIKEKNIVDLNRDLCAGGVETTATTLHHCVLIMASHPEIQQRIYQEFREVMGTRPIVYSDRKALPYYSAAVEELHRFISLSAINNPVRTTKEFTLEGYRVPKDSLIIINMEEIHRDPKVWRYPREFNPDNFREVNPTLNMSEKVPAYMPFLFGRRKCGGEGLARMETFMFLAALLQHYEVVALPDHPLPSIHEGVYFSTRHPLHFQVGLKVRDA